jgi:hypothetical protein
MCGTLSGIFDKLSCRRVAALSGPAFSQGTPQTLSVMKVDSQSLATGYRTSKATWRFAIGSASCHRRSFPVPAPKFIEAGLAVEKPGHGAVDGETNTRRRATAIPAQFFGLVASHLFTLTDTSCPIWDSDPNWRSLP